MGKKTPRGFDLFAEFRDSHGTRIRVQESSAVGPMRCWVFAKSPTLENPAPLLTVEQAQQLVDGLQTFIAEATDPGHWRNSPGYVETFGGDDDRGK